MKSSSSGYLPLQCWINSIAVAVAEEKWYVVMVVMVVLVMQSCRTIPRSNFLSSPGWRRRPANWRRTKFQWTSVNKILLDGAAEEDVRTSGCKLRIFNCSPFFLAADRPDYADWTTTIDALSCWRLSNATELFRTMMIRFAEEGWKWSCAYARLPVTLTGHPHAHRNSIRTVGNFTLSFEVVFVAQERMQLFQQLTTTPTLNRRFILLLLFLPLSEIKSPLQVQVITCPLHAPLGRTFH